MRGTRLGSSLTVLAVSPIIPNSGMSYSVPSLVRELTLTGITAGLLVTYGRPADLSAELYPVFQYGLDKLWSGLTNLPYPYCAPDLVVFHGTYVLPHAVLALQAERMGVPYVITPRGGMTRGAQRTKPLKKLIGNLLFFRRMVRRAAALHCLTEGEADQVRGWHQNIFVCGNGVDLPPPIRMARPGSSRRFRFTFVGRLDMHHKGLDLLLRACAVAQASLREAGARIGFWGPDCRGSRLAMERMAAGLGILDLIEIGGPVNGAAKEHVLSSSDVFVHTSRFEGHPLSVLEALSYGIPCILTPGTNMSREVAAAGAGWHVEPEPGQIAAGILAALREGPRLAGMGLAARRLAEQRYCWRHVAAQVAAFYRAVTTAHTRVL